jgi:DNA-binding CsgD family transcriptional regulator
VLPRLTRREEEIASLVAEGLTNADIAERLFLSRRTVEGHVERIRDRFGFRSRAQIAAWVTRMDREGRTVNRKHNLPERLSRLLGRDEELVELTALSTQTRLLTLTGAGGCGKSRLALELAARTLNLYPHGAWLAELAAASDPALVSSAVADVVGGGGASR